MPFEHRFDGFWTVTDEDADALKKNLQALTDLARQRADAY